MGSVLDHSGGGSTTPPGAEPYTCDCKGFRQRMIEFMCLRCLSIYVEGLPHVLQGKRLAAEMRRAASVLAWHLKDDPLLGNLPLAAALRAADRNADGQSQ